MKPVLQIIPLTLLLAGAVIGVWRGFDRKPDGKSDRSKGGRAKRKFWK